MSTNIYLGSPADYIKVWTIRNFADPAKTWVEYIDGTKTQLSISGQLGSSSIPDRANAKLIVIGNTITGISNSAFLNCSKLTSIAIPDSVTIIDYSALYQCYSLTSIIIGNSVESIGNGVFGYCSSLTSITIPDSVTSLGNQVFWNCTSLASVTFEGKTIAEVQAMSKYSWSLKSGCVIHCTDGDITL